MVFPLKNFLHINTKKDILDFFLKIKMNAQNFVFALLVNVLVFILMKTKIQLVSKELSLPKKNAQ